MSCSACPPPASPLCWALVKAATAQEHLLNGRLADPTHGLADLCQRLYQEAPRRTADEVVPYPVAFESFNRNGQGGKRPSVPSSSTAMAGSPRPSRPPSGTGREEPEGTLAHEVIEADALLLVVDAFAPPAQIEADFVEFGRFLRQLERGLLRSEVGGLPVFLVLTKCDLLAQPGDNSADWMECIEQGKCDVDTCASCLPGPRRRPGRRAGPSAALRSHRPPHLGHGRQ